MDKNKKKFSKLYDKNVNKIYRFIFLKVDSSETAEDLTSRVFSKAWDKFKTKEEAKKVKNPSAYIFQIARSEIAHYYRKKPEFNIISADSLQIADQNQNLEQKEKNRAEIAEVINALRKLSEEEQNIVIWRYLEGMSYKKIAEITGKKEGTVRVMVHRALKSLKKVMEEKENL